MPTTKTEPVVKTVRIPARCYLKYEEYMDWHLDHRLVPAMTEAEFKVNRRRILDEQES